MTKIRLTCGAVVFATGAAFAQPALEDPSSHGTLRHRAQDSELLLTQQAAKVPLAQAVEVAEGQGSGRAVRVSFKVDGRTRQYEVKVLAADGKLVGHYIDANSGQVLKSQGHPIEAYFTRLNPAEVQSARTTLRRAIVVAEEKVGGKASEAEVNGGSNAVRYEITVVADGRVRRIQVGEDGQVISAN